MTKVFNYFILLLSFLILPLHQRAQSTNDVDREHQALMDLYKATNGDNWHINKGWGNGNPSNSWYGLKVDAEGRVTRLDLSGNNLTGSLPESIGDLKKVIYFNVKQNELTGDIPSSIGNMRSLTHLLLNGRIEDMNFLRPLHPGKPFGGSGVEERSNNFTGSLPSSIGNLGNLEWLDLSGSDVPGERGLSGALPVELKNLVKLKGLNLAYNSLSSIPDLGNLDQLVHFVLSGNEEMKGEGFPAWMDRLTNLKYLWMGGLYLGGALPDLSDLRKLEIFDISKNDLTGKFPGYVIDGTMPNMNMCSMSWNKFNGNLPEFGSSIDNLTMFVVNGNSLEGGIPISLEKQEKMINLGLGWNNFSGKFPSDLTNLNQLRFIYANNNNFTGPLPLVDTSNEALKFLFFQNNKMSGEIPASMAEIGHLPLIGKGSLDISNNNFNSSDLQGLLDALESGGNLQILDYK